MEGFSSWMWKAVQANLIVINTLHSKQSLSGSGAPNVCHVAETIPSGLKLGQLTAVSHDYHARRHMQQLNIVHTSSTWCVVQRVSHARYDASVKGTDQPFLHIFDALRLLVAVNSKCVFCSCIQAAQT